MQSIAPFLPYIFVVVGLIIMLFFAKAVLGIVSIKDDEIGIVIKKFRLFGVNKSLPDGRIVALNGESGLQADTLSPGLHFWYWPWQYEIKKDKMYTVNQGYIGLIVAIDGNPKPDNRILCKKVECDNYQDARAFFQNGGEKGMQVSYIPEGKYRINTMVFKIEQKKFTEIGEDMVGIVTALDGKPIPQGHIAGDVVEGHSNFQDGDAFLANGGYRGLQQQILLSGSWKINPWLVEVEEIKMTEVPIGHVGVVISYVGKEGHDLSGEDFKYGNIVSEGEKGVLKDTLGPGKYAINTRIKKVELVPTTNLVLNWAKNVSEAHALDKNLSSIAVRSNDGFRFNLDVSQIIHIPSTEAPKVISRVGSMLNLVTQVLEPTIGNYFRNSAQKSDVIAFLGARGERQAEAKEHISKVLKDYNVQGVDTLIGDIVPPEDLMKTLTDRKIASEMKKTIEVQMETEKTRQALEQEKAIADKRKEVVASEQGIIINEKNALAEVKKAEGESKAMELRGAGEAAKITAVGNANASALDAGRKALGDEYGMLQIMKVISENKVKIVPEILFQGGGKGSGSVADLVLAKMLKAEMVTEHVDEKSMD